MILQVLLLWVAPVILQVLLLRVAPVVLLVMFLLEHNLFPLMALPAQLLLPHQVMCPVYLPVNLQVEVSSQAVCPLLFQQIVMLKVLALLGTQVLLHQEVLLEHQVHHHLTLLVHHHLEAPVDHQVQPLLINP